MVNIESLRYLMYNRKSTDDQKRQVRSLEDQEAENWEYTAKKKLNVIDTLEEKMSAKNPGRPVFNDMIRRIEAGEADGILAWSPDRIARNASDGGHIIHLLDTNVLVDLQFPTYTFENTATGKMMLSVLFSQSKYYSDKLSEDIVRGKDRKAAEGNWPGPARLHWATSPTPRGNVWSRGPRLPCTSHEHSSYSVQVTTPTNKSLLILKKPVSRALEHVLSLPLPSSGC